MKLLIQEFNLGIFIIKIFLQDSNKNTIYLLFLYPILKKKWYSFLFNYNDFYIELLGRVIFLIYSFLKNIFIYIL